MEVIEKILAREYGVKVSHIRQCLEATSEEHDITQERVGEILLSHRIEYLEKLPDELLIHIMMRLDYQTLVFFCSVSKRINTICDDEIFWKNKLAQDYPEVQKSNEKTFKQAYISHSTILNIKKGNYKGYEYNEDMRKWLKKQIRRLEKQEKDMVGDLIYLGYDAFTDTFIVGYQCYWDRHTRSLTLTFKIYPRRKLKFKLLKQKGWSARFYDDRGPYEKMIEGIPFIVDIFA